MGAGCGDGEKGLALQVKEALSGGDSAIMVQKSAKGLYTANLGNIKAGESVSIELHCAQLLSPQQGRIRVCVPTRTTLRPATATCRMPVTCA